MGRHSRGNKVCGTCARSFLYVRETKVKCLCGSVAGTQRVNRFTVQLWWESRPQQMGKKVDTDTEEKNNKVERWKMEAWKRYIIIPPLWHSVGPDLTRLPGCQSGALKLQAELPDLPGSENTHRLHQSGRYTLHKECFYKISPFLQILLSSQTAERRKKKYEAWDGK